MRNTKKHDMEQKGGFTLLEMMVVVAIFSVVIVLNAAAFFGIIRAQEHARAFQNAQDNLRFALESISKAFRSGENYYCSFPDTDPPPTVAVLVSGGPPTPCPGGSTVFSFQKSGGGTQIVYRFNAANKSIERWVAGSVPNAYARLTSSAVQINQMTFYVTGNTPNDGFQPKVTIILRASITDARGNTIPINLETTIDQTDRVDT